MTADMVGRARQNATKLGVNNVEFRLGEIEHLPVPDASVDVIISNCVINLSPEKLNVFREAMRVLKPGGRLAILDVVALQTLPAIIKNDLALISGCVGGTEKIEDIESMLGEAGQQQFIGAFARRSRARGRSGGQRGVHIGMEPRLATAGSAAGQMALQCRGLDGGERPGGVDRRPGRDVHERAPVGDGRGQVVVERPNRKLADLSFCAAGHASALATARYREIVRNVRR